MWVINVCAYLLLANLRVSFILVPSSRFGVGRIWSSLMSSTSSLSSSSLALVVTVIICGAPSLLHPPHRHTGGGGSTSLPLSSQTFLTTSVYGDGSMSSSPMMKPALGTGSDGCFVILTITLATSTSTGGS